MKTPCQIYLQEEAKTKLKVILVISLVITTIIEVTKLCHV